MWTISTLGEFKKKGALSTLSSCLYMTYYKVAEGLIFLKSWKLCISWIESTPIWFIGVLKQKSIILSNKDSYWSNAL